MSPFRSISDLQEVIHRLHGAIATHRESVPVREILEGETVWDGIVEVFHLDGHPLTERAYGWVHETGDPRNPFRYVTVLHIHPALTPAAAVQAFVAQEFRANASEEAEA